MFIVWQRISKNEWRLNAKNANRTKALKAYSGCVKSVGVNKCKLTEEIKPKLDIKAFVVEEETAEYGKPTIMKFVGDGIKLSNGDWIRVTPDFDPELRDFGIGTPLQYDGGRRKWEVWDREDLPGGKIEEIGENPELLKIVVYRYPDRTPATPEYSKYMVFDTPVSPDSHAAVGHYPEQTIKTKELDGSCVYGKKGDLLTTLQSGEWVIYGGPYPKGEIEETIDEDGVLTIKVYAGFQG